MEIVLDIETLEIFEVIDDSQELEEHSDDVSEETAAKRCLFEETVILPFFDFCPRQNRYPLQKSLLACPVISYDSS